MTDMEIACLGLSRDGAAVFIDRYNTDRRLVVFQERCRDSESDLAKVVFTVVY